MSKKHVRWTFDAAFKQEAVRRMQEQHARRVPVAVIARKLDVRPDLLRQWARTLDCLEQRTTGSTLRRTHARLSVVCDRLRRA